MNKVGFIDLGIMGRPMAGHLLAGGHSLFAYDIGAWPNELLDKGATSCGNGSEVARAADIIITMVPDTPDLEKALFGSGAFHEGC
jgi:2-hydroxy-3-oxopropionate reductase